MGIRAIAMDSLKNFVANLNTGRDKASSAQYTTPTVTDLDLNNAYRGAWLPKKIVDIPALDATRRWRAWQAGKEQITSLEAEEKRLNVKEKTKEALIKARLFGGAGIYIGIKGDKDPSLPLSVESIKQGGIDFLTVIPKRELNAGDLESDPLLPGYGEPKYYRVASTTGAYDIHPSRIVRFVGNAVPDEALNPAMGWGDSVLTAAFEPCRNVDATMANIASLIYEAKVDVLGIPGLADIMSDPQSRSQLVDRVQLAAMLKGTNGMLILDAEETHTSKSASFANLDMIANLFLQVASGAADIPMTRLLGQSPGGMNSTGESDLRNYYDRIQSHQELDITPAINILDECLIRSALGARPAEIHYVWNSLWQTTDKERADIGKTVSETIKTLADSKLFNPDVLSKAAENMLIERSVMPGLEAAIDEFGSDLPEDDQEEL